MRAAGCTRRSLPCAIHPALRKCPSGSTLPAQEIEVAIDYSAAFNAKLQGLYKVKVGDDAYAVTQMEPTSARYAFPSFDEPRFKTPFRVTLTVPKNEVAIANTQQIKERPSADGKWKTLTFATTKPLPTYLIALAVGPWDVVEGPTIPANSVRKQPIPLRGIGPRGTGPQLKWILDQTPVIVKYYEDYTAQPYPFDKLDLLGAPDFGAGAMENAGLIVFRDAYLRIDANSPATAHRGASMSPLTKSPTNGSAISSPCPGGTTSGSTKPLPPGRRGRPPSTSSPRMAVILPGSKARSAS